MEENLLQKLERYRASDFYPFHMPGHKRNMAHFDDPFSIDITEIDGFDNLFHAEGILMEAQNRAARLYRAEETYYLVNGSTCGILAAVSSSVSRGGRILMARNSHKAAYHAAFLNGLHVSYLYPEADMSRGINGSISPQQVEESLRSHSDIKAVLITSPTYDGVVSDIRAIAEAVHRAGAVLIVDEAHGAHFPMHPYFPQPSLACGADIVINSLHKTLPSMTQTALLHVQGPWADRIKLKKYLGIYQSSSPSYVLMAGMDACICLLQKQGRELFDTYTQRLEKLRGSLSRMQHLHLVDGTEKELSAYDFDCSKVLISTEHTGWNGPEFSALLRQEYHLEMEMEAEHYVTAITTVADTQEGFDRLETALLELDERAGRCLNDTDGCEDRPDSHPDYSWLHTPGEEILTIEEAENSVQRCIPLAESGGRISGEFVYLYPPGIPLFVPGERIPEEMPRMLAGCRRSGLKVQGPADYTLEQIRTVDR